MLRDRRREKGLTQSKIGRKIGISESYMNKLEKHPDHCNPTINLILKLSKELDIDPVKIFLFFIEKKNSYRY